MDALCPDVISHILGKYCLLMLPLCNRACRGWQKLALHVRVHPSSLADVARHNNASLPLLQNIAAARHRWPNSLVCRIARNAARGGHRNIVHHCLYRWSTSNVGDIVSYGARGGHLFTVGELAISPEQHYIKLANWCMAWAARGGHTRLVHVFRDTYGARNINWALEKAARGGHTDIVLLCLEWGARDIPLAMENASTKGHADILRILYERFQNQQHVPDVMQAADALPFHAFFGDSYRIRLLNQLICNAAVGGHVEIMRMCLEWGATQPANSLLLLGAANNHEEVLRFCHDTLGAIDVTGAYWEAAPRGYTRIMAICREWGADTYNQFSAQPVNPDDYLCQERTRMLRRYGRTDGANDEP